MAPRSSRKRLSRILQGAFRSSAYPSQEPERVVKDHIANLRSILSKKESFSKLDLELALKDAEAQLDEVDDHLDTAHPSVREQRAFAARLVDTLKEHIKKIAPPKGGSQAAETVEADPGRVRVRADPEGGLEALQEGLRGVFQDARNEDWLREVSRVWGDLPRAVAGRKAPDMDLGALSEAASELEAEARRLTADSSRARDDPAEAQRLQRKAEQAASASAYLRLLKAEVDVKKARVLRAEAARLRKQLQHETSTIFDRIDTLQAGPAQAQEVAQELDRLARLEQTLKERKASLTRIEKGLGIHDEGAWGEINRRLAQVENARKQLRSLRAKKERDAAQESKASGARETERRLRQGLVVESYDQLYARYHEAQRVLRDKRASKQAQDDAKAFMQRYSGNLKLLAKRKDAASRIEADERQVERLKGILPDLRGPERERVKSIIAQTRERVQAHRRLLERSREDDGEPLPPVDTWWRRAAATGRVSYRRGLAWGGERLEKARAPIRSIRKNQAFQGVADTLTENARVAGYGWLWKTQARRYRRQEENARQAQRIARSGMWAWWYTFSEPVRRTIVMSMTLAPLMVPWGIFQIAGWMTLVVAAYIINFLGSSIIELASLAVYAFLAGINLAGSLIKGLADGAAHKLLGAIGQCDAPTSSCAYESLDFTFGVHYPQAGPLLDPRLFFPTIFSNNSILSVLLDFLATLSPWLIIFLGAGAIFIWPILLMEDSDGWKRVLVALGIALAIVPAFVTQGFLRENFYHVAADLFRTGVGQVLTEPAEALARQARDAIQGATFTPWGGA